VPDGPAVDLGSETSGCSPLTGPLPKRLWSSKPVAQSIQVKVLSYNLFWWNLFQLRKGNDGSAGKLIKESCRDRAYDIMGFQECEDIDLVLRDTGRMGSRYSSTQGDKAICIAWLTERWAKVAEGVEQVAEDEPGLYGTRNAMWVRLKHIATGKLMFFMNHHGPLPVDTGGKCKGKVTAANLVRVIAGNAEEGDAIIVVGDFNASPACDTVKVLSQYLVHIFNGAFIGGIDNILSNTPPSSVIGTKNLGSGGSDHDAISAVLEVGTAGGMSPDGPAGVGEGKHTTPPPPAGEASPEGGCKCHCEWAEDPGACDASSPDTGSCCWQKCCTEVGITPANSGGGLDADDDSAAGCECDWATPAAC